VVARVEATAMERAGQPPDQISGGPPFHRLKAPHYSQAVVQASWRESEQVLAFAWPEVSLPPEVTRVGIGLVLQERGMQGARGVLTGPGEVELRLGGLESTLPFGTTRCLVERVVPRDLLPRPGDAVQLRLEMLHPEARSSLDVFALELRPR
jgi:hypothetical protein